MQLTLKDRVIILNTVLPQLDTRQNMKLKIAIVNKIKLTPDEEKLIVVTNLGNGMLDIGFKSESAFSTVSDFEFSDEELAYLRCRVKFIDQNGMFSEDTMPTYDKVLDTEPVEQIVETDQEESVE